MVPESYTQIPMTAASQQRRLARGHFLREPALIALQNMRAHKLRSFLMLLGVILSVSTLILVIALVSGMNVYFATRIANLGSNVFLIHKFPIISDTKELLKATRRNRDITWDDYVALRDNLKLPQAVGVEVRRSANLRAERQSMQDVELRGVTANIGDMDVEEVATGRYITDSDNEHRDMVCMIGADVAEKLFPNIDPLGKTLTVDGQEFQMVGVAKRIGNTLGQSQDNFVYIPIETWLKIYGRNNTLQHQHSGARAGVDGANQGRGPSADAGAPSPGPERRRQLRHPGQRHPDGAVEEPDRHAGFGHGGAGLHLSGDRRRGDHERDAGLGDRAHARDRHTQIAGRQAADILLQFLVESTVMARWAGPSACWSPGFWR